MSRDPGITTAIMFKKINNCIASHLFESAVEMIGQLKDWELEEFDADGSIRRSLAASLRSEVQRFERRINEYNCAINQLKGDKKFIFILTAEQNKWLEDRANEVRMHKAAIIRNLIDDAIMDEERRKKKR